MTLRKALQ
jgi:hypothetical protein